MRTLLIALFIFFLSNSVFSQSIEFKRYIMVTDTITDEGVTFAASSDDAEQENDEIDALYDDDIDAGWEGEPEDLNILTCGLRFRNITIPNGATIDSAFIIVNSHEAKTADDVAELTIAGIGEDNATTFTEDELIDSRPQTDASVEWTVDEEWGLWTYHRTPDLTPIVQEIVDRGGWSSGNALGFIILGKDQGPSEVENAREFESFENISDPEDGGDGQNHPERIPQLFIYYSAESGVLEVPIVVTDTITDEGVTFAASSDDAEQENDEIDALYDDDIDAGWEGEPDDQNILTAGLRFQKIALNKGATIDSAFIEIVSHEAKTTDDVAMLTIVGDATDDAETFTEDALIDSRPRTDASVEWTVDEEWGLWTTHRTPDVSPILNELVSRDGWEFNNDVAFIILGENQGPSELENAREFESFENIADPEDGGDGQNHPERIPKLIIYFSNNTTSLQEVLLDVEIEGLEIFPNPAQTMVNVELANSEESTILIFNAVGQLVKSIQSQGKIVSFRVDDFESGMYHVIAKQADRTFSCKLIKE